MAVVVSKAPEDGIDRQCRLRARYVVDGHNVCVRHVRMLNNYPGTSQKAREALEWFGAKGENK